MRGSQVVLLPRGLPMNFHHDGRPPPTVTGQLSPPTNNTSLISAKHPASNTLPHSSQGPHVYLFSKLQTSAAALITSLISEC